MNASGWGGGGAVDGGQEAVSFSEITTDSFFQKPLIGIIMLY